VPSPINLSRFDLITLRLFVATIDRGSLTQGAERFNISLAAASKRIAELEAHVGGPLLERSKRGVVPTAAGQTLLRHAIDIIANLEQLAVAMDDFRRRAGGHLRLWANSSALTGFLPKLLADYSKAHPSVVLDLEDTLSVDAVQAVSRGAAELGVIGENTPTPGLQAILCDIDELVVAMPAGHPLAEKEIAPIEEWLRCDIVGLNRSTSLMRQISATAEEVGRALKVRVQVRGFDEVCRMVSAGVGIGILPRASVVPHLKSMGLRVSRISGMKTERHLLLVMRDRGTLSPPAQAFVQMAETRMERKRAAVP
jgi:DNA-binding transcriptional LysR family regulator